jgi:hypothetical protein
MVGNVRIKPGFFSYKAQSTGPGTHIIKAHFAGDSDHTSSSATRIVTVK